jgi:hypothetical protein
VPDTRRSRKRERAKDRIGAAGKVAAAVADDEAEARDASDGDAAAGASASASATASASASPTAPAVEAAAPLSAPDAADDAAEEAAAALFMTGIPCVYSSEPARVKLLPLVYDAAAGDSPADFGALPGFRVRVLPVLGTMPAVFGQAMASYVLCELAGSPLAPAEAIPLPLSSLAKLQRVAAMNDHKLYGAAAAAAPAGWSRAVGGVSMEEAEFVLSELWHQRSPVSSLRLGTRGVQMQMVRWRPWAGGLPSNTVLLEQHEAQALIAATMAAPLLRLVGEAPPRAALEAAFAAAAAGAVGAEAFERIEARLAWARAQGWA